MKGFDKYKYSSVDTSPLSNYIMHPFWNQVVKLVPCWIAPNILTFVGFLLTVSNAVLLSYYDYYFYASSSGSTEIPLWVWLVCAINHFLAHTLDGIDGKQARRTKSSGPTGELMDHGVDSWTALFVPFCIYSMFGRADYSYSPFRVLFIFWAVFITFYLSHWEKYNTGILYLPWSYDSSQLILFILYIVSFCYSNVIWKISIPYINLTCGQIFEIVTHVMAFGFSVPITIFNVYIGYKNKTLKQPNLWESFRPLISLAILFCFTTFWAAYSPTNVIEIDPRMFYFMVGTLFSNICCRLIVSQMSSTRCEGFNWFLLPLTLIVTGVFKMELLQAYEIQILRIFALCITLAHIHYGVCVMRQMCKHFKINCFSLKPLKATKTYKNGDLD